VLGAVLAIATVAGVALPVFVYVYERRRQPESVPENPIRAPKRQRSIAFWTLGRFYQSLQQFDEYCDRLDQTHNWPTNDPTRPSRDDMLRFAESVLLTAATQVVPFSQGKANLFHFANSPTSNQRDIVSQFFMGAFPPSQVLARQTTYRPMPVKRDESSPSIAGECIRLGAPHLAAPKPGTFSQLERELGTTHILGMPAHRGAVNVEDDYCLIPAGCPAAITVDLRIVISRPLIYFIRRFANRRGRFVCHRLARYSALVASGATEDAS
jgi:hypothetical protein